MPSPTTHNPASGGGFRTDDQQQSKADEKLLKRIRERHAYMVKAHEQNRKNGDSDIKALYSEYGPWDDTEVKARIDQKRPCVHLPQLNQYPQAVLNQVKANPQGVKVNPAGGGATDETANLRGNRIRAINAECNAKQAFLTALECALERGYGVITMETEDIEWDSIDQRIKVVREPDPNAVLWDPDYREVDASDIQDGFKLWRLPREEYKRRWPNAQVTDFTVEDAAIAPDWVGEQTQLVARYSYFETTERHIYAIEDSSQPRGFLKVFKDELAEGVKVERVTVPGANGKKQTVIIGTDGAVHRVLWEKPRAIEKTVKQCTTNGVEILAKNDWAGKWIPIFPMIGKEVWIRETENGPYERRTYSYIRQAIHGQKAFNSAKTNEVEAANMVPKVTYIGYEGQFDTQTDWQNINRVPTPFATVKATTEEAPGHLLPPPERAEYEPPIQAMEVMAEAARRAIQAAIGSYGFTIQDDTNVKSGKAVNALKAQSDIGSYHFIDSYETTIRHVGRAESDLLDKIEDTPRDVSLVMDDGTHKMIRINEPYQDPDTGETVEHRYVPKREIEGVTSDVKHDVVIDSGKSYETQQLEASEFVEGLVASPLGPRIADLAVKWKGLGTYGDQMAERLKPPDIAEKEGATNPEQARQLAGMLQAQNAKLTETVQQLLAERESKQQDLDSKKEIELAKIASQERIAALEAQIEQLKISAQLEMKKMEIASKSAIVSEELTSTENLAKEGREADRDIAELSHKQAIEQQEVAAALTPPAAQE